MVDYNELDGYYIPKTVWVYGLADDEDFEIGDNIYATYSEDFDSVVFIKCGGVYIGILIESIILRYNIKLLIYMPNSDILDINNRIDYNKVKELYDKL